MAKYKAIPKVIEATQWFKLGDHPEVTAGVTRWATKEDDKKDLTEVEASAEYGQLGKIALGSYFGVAVLPGDYLVESEDGKSFLVYAKESFEADFVICTEKEKFVAPPHSETSSAIPAKSPVTANPTVTGGSKFATETGVNRNKKTD